MILGTSVPILSDKPRVISFREKRIRHDAFHTYTCQIYHDIRYAQGPPLDSGRCDVVNMLAIQVGLGPGPDICAIRRSGKGESRLNIAYSAL
jgi:hypothetical protein